MIWPILFAILFIIFAWRSIYDFGLDHDFLDRFMDTLLLLLLAALVFGFGVGFSFLAGIAVPKQWTGPETTQLVSLRDSDGVSGQFFLGTGSIDATQYYFFYKEAGQGYQPGKVEVSNNVTVFEEKGQNGQLKTYTYKFSNPLFRWIALELPNQKYEFIIPEGSLKKNFVLQ